eukprot:s7672_g2.t1
MFSMICRMALVLAAALAVDPQVSQPAPQSDGKETLQGAVDSAKSTLHRPDLERSFLITKFWGGGFGGVSSRSGTRVRFASDSLRGCHCGHSSKRNGSDATCMGGCSPGSRSKQAIKQERNLLI